MIVGNKNINKLIEKLLSWNIKDEEEHTLILNVLEDYQVGLIEEIKHSKPEDKPEDILRRAREKNKPILL